MRICFLAHLSFAVLGCSLGFDGFDSYSVIKDPNFQNKLYFTPRSRADVLLLMDNSSLMEFLQTRFQDNTAAFISEFTSRNVEFQIAVGLSDAYRKKYHPEMNYSTRFSQGVGALSGYRIVTPLTPNPSEVLRMNLTVGVDGHPDVRGLESLEDIIADPANAELIRNFSHFATVFITNEDDFSNNSPQDTLIFSLTDSCIYNCATSPYQLYYFDYALGDYIPNIIYYQHTQANPDPSTGRYLIPLSRYNHAVSARAGVTTAPMRAYSFHAYALVDHVCREARNAADGLGDVHFIAKRYMDLITMTGGGVLASPCQTPDAEIRRLARGIISENFRFKLPSYASEVPFTVSVGGVIIPQGEENGWSYNPATTELRINGSAIPRVDQAIEVEFQI
ncbi:MAG: hypothetical protein M9899_11105 [Bdellovibrionaceae bacterium]|nr:hypothetical protein [Pseudobdellovibrionaceae bacterium]